MEIEDFETIHLAQEVAREKGWDHVMETIRKALREEAVTLPACGRRAEDAVDSGGAGLKRQGARRPPWRHGRRPMHAVLANSGKGRVRHSSDGQWRNGLRRGLPSGIVPYIQRGSLKVQNETI